MGTATRKWAGIGIVNPFRKVRIVGWTAFNTDLHAELWTVASMSTSRSHRWRFYHYCCSASPAQKTEQKSLKLVRNSWQVPPTAEIKRKHQHISPCGHTRRCRASITGHSGRLKLVDQSRAFTTRRQSAPSRAGNRNRPDSKTNDSRLFAPRAMRLVCHQNAAAKRRYQSLKSYCTSPTSLSFLFPLYAVLILMFQIVAYRV